MDCIRKETAAAAVGAAAEAMEDVCCCGNCMHRKQLHGSEQVRLMCANRSGYRGSWYAVSESDSCARFKQAVNVPVLPDGARAIPLTQGKFALVDEADYADLIRHSWCATREGGKKPGNQATFYATRTIKKSRTSKANRGIRMHRQIMAAKPGQIVDHINHNGLDNRRCNLRICSQAENVRNQRAQRGRTSRYKGVSRNWKLAKWQAHIACEGQRYSLGLFDSEIDAARAYNEKARELFGEFAYLNDV